MRDWVCGTTLVHRSHNLRLVLRQSEDAEISDRLIQGIVFSTGNGSATIF